MRQWELFGITDSQPAWTPPKPHEVEAEPEVEVIEPEIEVVEAPATIRLVTTESDEGEQERLVSA
jgi:hypothetical protein